MNKSIPLSCIDKLFLAIDSKDEPMVFHVIATLRGGINPERLNQALLSVMDLHPVMKTVISGDRGIRGKYLWPRREIKEDFDKNILVFQDLAKLKDEEYERRLRLWLNTPIDLAREFPFKVLLIRRKEFEFSLIFSCHHCATDGTGARSFILTVIGQYIKGSGDLSLPPHLEEPKKGDELLRLAVSQGSGWRGFRKRASSLLRLFPILIAKLYPPTRVAHERSRQLGRVHIIHGTINASELKGITYMSKSLGVSIKDLVTAISPDLVRSGLFDDVTAFTEKMRLGTINDLLLAACFRAVQEWNRIHGRISKKISIMVPINIRPRDQLYEMVSNQLSMISVSTNAKDRDDPSELLRMVSSRAKYISEKGIHLALLHLLLLLSYLPMVVMKLFAKFFLFTGMYVDTLIITNLGSVSLGTSGKTGAELARAGEFEITSAIGTPPFKFPMAMGICAVTLNDNLNISLICRDSIFPEEKARAFLDLYLDEIRSYKVSM